MLIHRKGVQYGPVSPCIVRHKEFSHTSAPVHADHKLVTMGSQRHDAAAVVGRFVTFLIQDPGNIFPSLAQVRGAQHLTAVADIKIIICGQQKFYVTRYRRIGYGCPGLSQV